MHAALPVFIGEEELAPCDGGNNADLVSLFQWRGFFLQEANVFIVDEDIHEAANVSALIANTLEEAGVGGVEVREDFADICAGGGDEFLLIRELAEGGWDADLDGHFSC